MPDSALKKSERARRDLEELKLLTEKSNTFYWERAERLYRLKKNNAFRYVTGDETQSFSSFLSEMNIAPSSANQKVKNWEFFVEKHGMRKGDLAMYDTSCLYYVYMNKTEASRDDVESWMKNSLVLGRGDFIQEIKSIDCQHDESKEETIYKCVKCGRKIGNKKHA